MRVMPGKKMTRPENGLNIDERASGFGLNINTLLSAIK